MIDDCLFRVVVVDCQFTFAHMAFHIAYYVIQQAMKPQ